MVHITATDASFVFPLIGTDSLRAKRGKNKALSNKNGSVGGKIVSPKRGQYAVLALDSLNFELKPGVRLGIKGHNGAGKSTLLRALAGIVQPTQGSLECEGRCASLFNLSLGLNREISGYDNVIIKGLMYGLNKEEITSLIPDIHEFSELGDYIYMPVKSYSSGMIMRLLFATATCLKPDIMLLDEWITAGDTAFRKKVDDKMQTMMHDTSIVVVASHDEKRLEKWSNRLMTLQAGKIVADEA